MKRIKREIGILRDCQSPYLVRLGDVELTELIIDDNCYVTYSEELLEGETLRQCLNSGHKPQIDELVEVSRCLINAIQELKSKKVIHRDIKPDNIIKTNIIERPFVLLDLGIAFQIGGTQVTQPSSLVPGTLYYIAPEMLEVGFRQSLDYRSDLYTVGLTLYEYASGKNPFVRQGENQFSTLYRIKEEFPESLHKLRPDLPEEFCLLVNNLIKKIPALRPANIKQILSKLENIK